MNPSASGSSSAASVGPASLGALRGEFDTGRLGWRGYVREAGCLLLFPLGLASLTAAFFLLRDVFYPPPGYQMGNEFLEVLGTLLVVGAILIAFCVLAIRDLIHPTFERLAVYDRAILYCRDKESETIPWEAILSVEEKGLEERPPGRKEREAAIPTRRTIASYWLHRSEGKDLLLDSRFRDFHRLGEVLHRVARDRSVRWQWTDLSAPISE